jgi:membrane protein
MPRAPVQWRDVWAGGLIAGLVWETGKQLFGWYLSNATRYNVLYGSVEAVIVFLLWAYLSAQIFLLGAEFTAQYERWRQAGGPVETRPLREWMTEGPAVHVVQQHKR